MWTAFKQARTYNLKFYSGRFTAARVDNAQTKPPSACLSSASLKDKAKLPKYNST